MQKSICKMVILVTILIFIFLNMATLQANEVNNSDNDTMDEVSLNTYSDLNNEINKTSENSVLNLTNNVKYNETCDESLVDGVKISKNITLVGYNNSYIDGNKLARGLFIDSYCNVVLQNITFINCFSKSGGAGIYLSSYSNLTIKNCIFKANDVYNSDGGAINARESTNVEIIDSQFYNNTSVRSCNLTWQEFKAGMGSAIFTYIGSTLRLNRSLFKYNDAFLTTILIVSHSDIDARNKISSLYVDDCLFENNVAGSSGVIYLDELGTSEIKDSVFKNNLVKSKGGTVVLDSSTSSLVENCMFENNTAVEGGAIFVKADFKKYLSVVSIKNCNFTNNFALEEGGAISIKYGIVNISECNFYKNNATTYGGGLYSKYGSIKITSSNFINNHAQDGGGAFLKSDNITVKKSSFINNVAYKRGGAISSKILNVVSSNCIFKSNTAPIAKKIYGAFKVKVTQYKLLSGKTRLKIKLYSTWGLSRLQKIKFKFKGYSSGWVKTNSKGTLTIDIPKKIKVGKSYVTISMENGVCFIDSWKKLASAKITHSKEVKKLSKIKVKIKNKSTGKLIKKTKFIVKIYTGKKYKTIKLKTNSKGILKISSSKLSKGKHKIIISLHNSVYGFTKKFSIKIK